MITIDTNTFSQSFHPLEKNSLQSHFLNGNSSAVDLPFARQCGHSRIEFSAVGWSARAFVIVIRSPVN
jgi:hypothetical protein